MSLAIKSKSERVGNPSISSIVFTALYVLRVLQKTFYGPITDEHYKELKDASTVEKIPVVILITVIQEAIDLAERRERLTVQGYARRVQVIENRFAAWLLQVARRRRAISPELDRLVNHVANHFDEWLLFLREPEVPPTNNHAERMLRPAVITRKVGGCNKTLLGALVHSILASIMVTCKQQGQRFLELARQLWSAGQPQAIPLASPPSPATPTGST